MHGVWYRVGTFRLCPSDRRLLHSDGTPVAIEPRTFDILVALVRRPNKLVTRQELYEAVWGPDVYVEEGNLTTAIHALRRLFADSRSSPRYIETVVGHGYRLIAPVGVEESTVTSEPRTKAVTDLSFRASVHRFVPVYLGQDRDWRQLKAGHSALVAAVGSSELHTFKFGCAVWHDVIVEDFDSIADYALDRRDSYRRHLREPNELLTATLEYLGRRPPLGDDMAVLLNSKGQFRYVFSIVELTVDPSWTSDRLHGMLRLLTVPRVLCPMDSSPTSVSLARTKEARLLASGFAHEEARRFGLDDRQCGYASWAGVSLVSSPPQLRHAAIELQRRLQPLWLLGHLLCSADEASLSRSEEGHSLLRDLVAGVRSLRSVGPTDHIELRSMCEAVLDTSRIDGVTREALRHWNVPRKDLSL